MWSSWYDRGYPLLGKPGSLHTHLFHILYKYLQSRKRMKVKSAPQLLKTAPGHWFITLTIHPSGPRPMSSSPWIDSSTQDSNRWLEWNKRMGINPKLKESACGKPLLVFPCMETEAGQRQKSKGGRCNKRGQKMSTLLGNNSICPRDNLDLHN